MRTLKGLGELKKPAVSIASTRSRKKNGFLFDHVQDAHEVESLQQSPKSAAGTKKNLPSGHQRKSANPTRAATLVWLVLRCLKSFRSGVYGPRTSQTCSQCSNKGRHQNDQSQAQSATCTLQSFFAQCDEAVKSNIPNTSRRCRRVGMGLRI